MKIDLYNDGIGYITDDVSSVPTNLSNYHEKNRAEFVTDLAAISRGKTESVSYQGRYGSLLKEAAPRLNSDGTLSDKTPSRPLEFLPVVIDFQFDKEYSDFNLKLKFRWIDMHYDEFITKIARYSYIDFITKTLYTNMRCLLNAGIDYEDIPYNTKEEISNFKAFRVKVPMFVWSQIMTHTQLSKESQSDRVSTQDDYWLPEDLNERLQNATKDTLYDPTKEVTPNDPTNPISNVNTFILARLYREKTPKDVMNYILDNIPQNEIQIILKGLGYKKEIYQRAPYYFKYKEMVITGWANDPNGFHHFLLERNAYKDTYKNWTQKETEEFSKALKRFF